jgi:hypothetical protein
MNAGQPPADLGGSVEDDVSVLQLPLPHLKEFWRQVFHCKHSGAGVLGQQGWNSLWHKTRHRLDPGSLLAVALDRRPPVGRHPQARQGPLNAKRRGAGVHQPDIR